MIEQELCGLRGFLALYSIYCEHTADELRVTPSTISSITSGRCSMQYTPRQVDRAVVVVVTLLVLVTAASILLRRDGWDYVPCSDSFALYSGPIGSTQTTHTIYYIIPQYHVWLYRPVNMLVFNILLSNTRAAFGANTSPPSSTIEGGTTLLSVAHCSFREQPTSLPCRLSRAHILHACMRMCRLKVYCRLGLSRQDLSRLHVSCVPLRPEKQGASWSQYEHPHGPYFSRH